MDTNTVANTISGWTDLGLTIPTRLKAAAELYDSAAYVEGPYTGLDLSKVTGKNLEQTVTALAEQMAVEEQFAKAKQQVRDRLGRELLMVAGEVVDELVEALRPGFDRAASQFCEAVMLLGDDLSAAGILRSGHAQTYSVAVEAQDELLRVDRFLAGLAHLPRWGGNKHDPQLRILAPKDRNQLQALTNAHGKHDPAKYGDLNAMFVCAAREQIPFVMHLPDECSELRHAIETAKIEPNPNARFVRFK